MRRFWLLVASQCLPVLAQAAEAVADAPAGLTTTFSADVSVGREANRAPGMAVTDAESSVLVGPMRRVSAAVWRASVMGAVDAPLADGQRLFSNWRLDQQKSGSGDAMGYRIVSADLKWGTSIGNIPVSVGPGVQALWVSGSRFRVTTSLDADATLQADPAGIWSVFASVGRYRHPGDLQDLNARAWSVSSVKRWTAGLPGLDALELDMGLRGERNASAMVGLSSTGAHIRSGVERSAGPWLLSLGVTWQSTRYDGSVFDSGPARRDAFVSWDASASVPISPGWRFRVSTSTANNRANLPMFFQNSRGWSVSLAYATP